MARPADPPANAPFDPGARDLSLAELFDRWPALGRVFLDHHMNCLGCPIAPFHGVADACGAYRIDEAAFRARLRAAWMVVV